MSIRNENKEILGEVYKALDHIDESRQLFTSLERNSKIYGRSVRKHQRN